MSQVNTEQRIVIEQPCEHGNVGGCAHRFPTSCDVFGCSDPSHFCPGGSRRILEPSDELVERVAMTLHDNDEAYTPPYWSDCTEDMKHWYRKQARAVLVEIGKDPGGT